tara:strand:+ start:893 stop:1156 length:264 start_codon:yes stop_codon:yes gene_type:complete
VANFQAQVLVNLRPSVLDPAGEAVRSAAKRLGVDGIESLRIGKSIDIQINAPDESEAKRRLKVISERLLSNPVIEDWEMNFKSDPII